MLARKSFEADRIYSLLQDCKTEKGMISLSIPYRGLILSQDVKVFSVNPDFVVLQAPRRDVCTVIGNQIIMHDRKIPEAYHASIIELNAVAGQMVVSEIESISDHWVERTTQRVQPKLPEPIVICVNGMLLRADLCNISILGAGAIIYPFVIADEKKIIGSEVRAEFDVPGKLWKMKVTGKVVNYTPMRNMMVRLGIRWILTPAQRATLELYIEQRKREIEDEIWYLFAQSREEQRVSALFF